MSSSSQLSLNSLPVSEHWSVSSGWGRQSSSTGSTVSATDCVTYGDLEESINRMQICPYMTQEHYIPISHFASDLKYGLMARIVSRTSEELRLLNHLNHPSYRPDPWNPAPYLLCTLDRDETDIYACFEELTPYDQPPFRIVAHYLDFFRQVLEVAFRVHMFIHALPKTNTQGLTFLHELYIVNLNCAKRSSFMIDLSAGSSTSSAEIPCSRITPASQPPPYLSNSHSVSISISSPSLDSTTNASQRANIPLAAQDLFSTTPNKNKGLLFDRAKFPVKYYIVDYSDAVQLSYHTSARYSSVSDRDQDQHAQNTPSPYVRDVRDLGTFFSNVLDDVPEMDSNFRPLVSAMITGELTADGTRRLFEALCHTLEASVFDVSVPSPCPAADTYTRSSGPSSSSDT